MEDNTIEENKDEATSTPGKKVYSNYILNVIYQVFTLIVPLVLTPYLSRVLGAEMLGKYSFSNSLMQYFYLVACLGCNYYAQRELIKYQNDKYKQSQAFWEIMILRGTVTLICFGAQLIMASIGVFGSYKVLMVILSLNVLAVLFDVTFVFQSQENFKTLVLRSFIVKIVAVVLIFLFVKKPSDLWLYCLINNGGVLLLSYIILCLAMPKYITKVKIKDIHPMHHFLPIMGLFIPSLVMSLYTILDKTLIGLLIPGTYEEAVTVFKDGVSVVTIEIKKMSDVQNGYYEQAEKLIKIPLTIITCLGVVMIPRNSKEFSHGNIKQLLNNVYFSFKFVWFLAIPLAIGLAAISRNLNEWYFGKGYEPVIQLMITFSPIALAMGLSNVIGVQYLIPTGRDKEYTISILIGTVFNLTLTIILLITVGTIGAVIASVIGEFVILFVDLFIIRHDISIKKALLCGWKNVIAGIIMGVVLFLIEGYFPTRPISTIILVLIGMAIYFIVTLILRDEMLFTGIKMVLSKLHKKNDQELENKEN